jgi:hypothetical protein
MPSTTRAAIRQEVHDRLYAGTRTFRRLRNGPDSSTLTEFTAITSITDTALKEVAAFPNDFARAWIRLKYFDNSGTPALQEQVSRIHQFDPAAGTITFSPTIGTVNVTAATVDGEYEIWPDVHPDEADLAIDRILADVPAFTYLPVTLIQDGDMEDSASDDPPWEQSGLVPTKEASVFNIGRQSLAGLPTSTGQGFVNRARAYAVTPNEPLFVSLFIRNDILDSNILIQVFDLTASTNMDSVLVFGNEPTEVRFPLLTADSSQELVDIRVTWQGASNSDGLSFHVGPITLLSDWRSRYAVDSVDFGEDITKLYSLPVGQPLQDTDTYAAFSKPFVEEEFELEHHHRDGNPTTIVVPRLDRPLFMKARQRHTSLSSDTSTTTADKDTVVNGVLYYLEKARGNERASREHLRTFNRLLELQGFGPQVFEQADRQLIRFR